MERGLHGSEPTIPWQVDVVSILLSSLFQPQPFLLLTTKTPTVSAKSYGESFLVVIKLWKNDSGIRLYLPTWITICTSKKYTDFGRFYIQSILIYR